MPSFPLSLLFLLLLLPWPYFPPTNALHLSVNSSVFVWFLFHALILPSIHSSTLFLYTASPSMCHSLLSCLPLSHTPLLFSSSQELFHKINRWAVSSFAICQQPVLSHILRSKMFLQITAFIYNMLHLHKNCKFSFICVQMFNVWQW